MLHGLFVVVLSETQKVSCFSREKLIDVFILFQALLYDYFVAVLGEPKTCLTLAAGSSLVFTLPHDLVVLIQIVVVFVVF